MGEELSASDKVAIGSSGGTGGRWTGMTAAEWGKGGPDVKENGGKGEVRG